MLRLGIKRHQGSDRPCSTRTGRPCACGSSRAVWVTRLLLLLLPILLALLPGLAKPDVPDEVEAASELVAEAFYLWDPVPPGGTELSLAVAFLPAVDGGPGFAPSQRLQLALAFTDRLGMTADLGLGNDQGRVILDTPGASLKLMLREPTGGRTGLAASLDLFGSTRALAATRVGLGLGALRAFGLITLRASASMVSGTAAWGPHLHAGVSAAIALSAGIRLLAEVLVEAEGRRRELAGGPTLRVALAEQTTLAAGVLLPLHGDLGMLAATVQLVQGI